jgi:hypothetical protein
MSLPSFFRPAKPRQFHYEPVFYDVRKEKMQERIRTAGQNRDTSVDSQNREAGTAGQNRDTSVDSQAREASAAGQFRRTIGRGSISSRHLGKKKTSSQSVIRLIVIFLFLLLISYLLLFI